MNTTQARTRKEVNVLIMTSNIKTKNDVEVVSHIFKKIKFIHRWTVDLDDRERVLKVETSILTSSNIATILERFGYDCAELDH